MNLTRDQEQFVKNVAQALVERRESAEIVAWIVLGIFLVVGSVLCLLVLRWLWLAGRTASQRACVSDEPAHRLQDRLSRG